jgi:alpha-methylacyl-CoA racemase
VQIVPPFYAYSAHRRMQRVLLDMKAPEGRETFLRLAERADVVIESFRPGVVDRLGIGWDAVSARNPRAVYCSTTGFGQTGPHSQRAGHDLNYLGVGGYLHCNGRGPDGAPPIPGLTVADSAGGGMHAVMAIMAALVRRATTGAGAYLDVSIADGVLGLMALAADEYLATGDEPGPRHGLLTGRYACYDTYPTRDGKWLTVAAIEPRFWANLCRELGLEQWADRQHEDEVQDQIRADVRGVLLTRDRDDWTERLAAADTCVAPVLTVPEAIADEQFVARGDFVDAVHPEQGTFRQVGPVFAGMQRPDAPYEARDATITDTDAVLAVAGFSADEIAKLQDAGVVA